MGPKRQKRLLLIDHDPSTMEWLEAPLAERGYDVKKVSMGERGEEIVRMWRPDAVVTDVTLPGGDGIEVVRRLKRFAPEAEIVVIAEQGSSSRSVEALKGVKPIPS